MSITLSLATSAERAAALAALTVYINHLDGDTRTLPLPFADNPEVGVVTPPVQTEVQVIPNATIAFAANPVAAAGYITPPVPPAAPTAPLPNTPMPEVEVDSKGVQWNAELHAGNKSKNKDGTWRAKRNASGATDDAPTPPAPPAAVAAPVAPPVPPAAVAAPVAPPAPAAAAGDPTTAQEFTKAIMPLMQAGKITAVQVAEACQMNNVANLPALSATPAAVPAVWSTLKMLAGF